ncbi:MAG TPA: sensor histidine kinase [Bacteroidetes bacterium]|nr:sensor histidine kinase [Bacteroidota bacterium]
MMKIIRKEKLYWICQLGGWLLFTLLELATYIGIDGLSWKLLTNAVVNFLLGISATHLYRVFLIQSGWLTLPLYKIIPRGMLGVILMSTLLTVINIWLDRFTYPVLQTVPVDAGTFFGYFFNLSKYVLLWSLTYHLFQYWERSLKAERDRYQIEAILKENQYNNLKTQLNPHFLFNSLNSIRTLVDMDPEIAKNAITQLSGLLRSSLQMGKHKTVSLADELQTVKDYLAIESIRFDDRLKVYFDIDEAAEKCNVPPMMLQTLTENAVKHGISSLKNGGEIAIEAHKYNGTLQLKITNTGHYQPKVEHEGVGIENTLERLKILYDNRATFSIQNDGSHQVVTEITIPL